MIEAEAAVQQQPRGLLTQLRAVRDQPRPFDIEEQTDDTNLDTHTHDRVRGEGLVASNVVADALARLIRLAALAARGGLPRRQTTPPP